MDVVVVVVMMVFVMTVLYGTVDEPIQYEGSRSDGVGGSNFEWDGEMNANMI